MNQEQDKNFHKTILEKIESGKVTMHSKAFLVWRTVLWALGALLLAALLIFIVSFIIFVTRASGVSDLPQFGLHGLQEFLTFFPWLFIPAVILFLWLLERFVIRHSLAYRIPALYSAAGITAAILGVGLIVSLTPLHHTLYESAMDAHLPFGGGIYKFFGQIHPDDFHIGNVVSVSGSAYTLHTREEPNVQVITNQQTRYEDGRNIVAGDFIEVVGREINETITAIHIRKIDPQNPFPLRPPRH